MSDQPPTDDERLFAECSQKYWIGHDEAIAGLCCGITKILDGKDSGSGTCAEPWESVRRRLLALRNSVMAIEAALHANRCYPDWMYTVITSPQPMYRNGWEPNPEYRNSPSWFVGEECWRKRKEPNAPVFVDCNVCGIKLKDIDENSM